VEGTYSLTDIPLPTGWRSGDYADWLGKPHDAGAFRSDVKMGLTHRTGGTLKWQIAARPLTVY
jgi:hypothetical protein